MLFLRCKSIWIKASATLDTVVIDDKSNLSNYSDLFTDEAHDTEFTGRYICGCIKHHIE